MKKEYCIVAKVKNSKEKITFSTLMTLKEAKEWKPSFYDNTFYSSYWIAKVTPLSRIYKK